MLLNAFLEIAVPRLVVILIEYVLIRTFITCILELLCVPAVILSFLRRMLGQKWTKNKQNIMAAVTGESVGINLGTTYSCVGGGKEISFLHGCMGH